MGGKAVKKIKAVLFDLDGTLFQYQPTSGEVFLAHLRECGFEVSEEERVRAEHWVHFYFAHSDEIQADDRDFGNDQKRFWINFTRRLQHNMDLYHAGSITFAEFDASVQGWINHVRFGDTRGLRRVILGRVRLSPPK